MNDFIPGERYRVLTDPTESPSNHYFQKGDVVTYVRIDSDGDHLFEGPDPQRRGGLRTLCQFLRADEVEPVGESWSFKDRDGDWWAFIDEQVEPNAQRWGWEPVIIGRSRTPHDPGGNYHPHYKELEDAHALDVIDDDFVAREVAAGRACGDHDRPLPCMECGDEAPPLPDIDVTETLDAIIQAATEAKAALADEHEGNLRDAVRKLSQDSTALLDLVTRW